MLRFEHLSYLQVAGLFALLAVPIVWLGIRSMAGLGKLRQWLAIGLRLSVVMLLLLALAGARWERINKDVEVLLLRDVSQSTANVTSFPGKTLESSIDDYLRAVMKQDTAHKKTDRIGIISFDNQARVEAIPQPTIAGDARPIRDPSVGTDVSSAIQLALASKSKDAMSRLLLVWDGNATSGDLEAALSQAAALKVPIDVVPLDYNVTSEVLVERFVAPAWRRENEPFSIDIILRSTNATPTTGNLSVLQQGTPMDLDLRTPGMQSSRRVTLKPGQNVEHIEVPATAEPGVHQFKAIFEAPNVTTSIGGTSVARTQGDTLQQNNVASAFTFIRGKGRVLYVDSVPGDGGRYLREAINREGIEIDPDRTSVAAFPTDLATLQNYDAVILNNVRRGPGGLSESQEQMLASYVRDTGGGLVVVGGEDSFGAGGWGGSEVEKILPVSMDIPAERQIPKGALVLIVHSCEMPNGNFWGEQCAIKAVETLSAKDEVGVLTYSWAGQGGVNGSNWEYPLSEKSDGTKVRSAIKNMQVGDMPSFDDSMNVALNGVLGQGGLLQSKARQKHVIIISDGDPAAPVPALMNQYIAARVSVSTVSVYPHNPPNTMQSIAKQTGGTHYGPVEQNPSQLPQIFIKEASIVRRSLISEDEKGIAVKPTISVSEIVKGIDLQSLPSVYGLVLTSKKQSPTVEMPLVAGEKNDPLLAYWQAGLGKSAIFTSDAFNRWASLWVGSSAFDKFWAQIVRSVARPAESSDFDVSVTTEGTKGKIVVEALDQENAFKNFLTIGGSVVGPNLTPVSVNLVQVGPGRYEAQFDANDPGNYVVGLSYRGGNNTSGVMRSGTVVNTSPELRDLQSNRANLQLVADRTGGRVLAPYAATGASLFTRDGLATSTSPKPIWDYLLMVTLAVILLDVANRRIAWDLASIRRARQGALEKIRSYTTTPDVKSTGALDALRNVRSGQVPEKKVDLSKQKFDPTTASPTMSMDSLGVTDPGTAKPVPKSPAEKPGSAGGDSMSALLEARRRKRQQLDDDTK